MSDPDLPIDRVDTGRLLRLLQDHGWELVGRRSGVYSRLRQRGELGQTIVVPQDPTEPDFDDILGASLRVVMDSDPDQWSRQIRPLLFLRPSDSFRFRKETSAPVGLIAWRTGEELIASARATLLAGAKAYMEPARHFSNRFGQFANRYLDQVLMAQSDAGSYVVTALAPADGKVAIRKSSEGTLQLEHVDVATGREISESVVTALEATAGAIEHFRESGSLSGFDDGVRHGVSYELAHSLRDFVASSDGSDITVEYDPAAAALDEGTSRERHHFEFRGGDSSVLDQAAHHLTAPAAVEMVTVRGRVHLLTRKQAGGPGVVGVDDGKQRYRVRLESDEQYHDAVVAHDSEAPVSVRGELSREGTLNWLYNARLRPAVQPNQPSGTSSPDQLPL